MARDRRSGILLHPTSLPGPHGAGDLGGAAHRFAGWLADAGQRLWQVLPLGPTGFGDSPLIRLDDSFYRIRIAPSHTSRRAKIFFPPVWLKPT